MDTQKLVADFASASASVATLTLEKGQVEAKNSALEADLTAARARVTELETQLAAATAAEPEGLTEITAERDAAVAERDEAVTTLSEQLDNLLVASGKPKLEGDAKLTKVADLKAQIATITSELTAILPVDGVSRGAGGNDDKGAKLGFSLADAFGIRK